MTKFQDVPIGHYFLEVGDPDGYVCRKITESEAIDATCAPGFCFPVNHEQEVILCK